MTDRSSERRATARTLIALAGVVTFLAGAAASHATVGEGPDGAGKAAPTLAETAPAVDDAGPTTTTRPTAVPPAGTTGDIIPRPGSGAAPQSAGDRGGAGQVGVFVAICGALALIVALAVRDMRKRRDGP